MDVKRDPAILKRKRIRQGIFLAIGAVAVLGISVAVMRLKPAAPGVPATTLWFGTVKRGSFTREVRGAGTLVPEDIRWIPATTSGRVETSCCGRGRGEAGTVDPRAEQPGPRSAGQRPPKMQWAAGEGASSRTQKAQMRSTRSRRRPRSPTPSRSSRSTSGPRRQTSSCQRRAWSPTYVSSRSRRPSTQAQNRARRREEDARDRESRTRSRSSRPQEAQVEQQKAAYEPVRASARRPRRSRANDDRRAAGRSRSKCGQQVGAGHEPRARRRPEHAQGGGPDLGNADQGSRDRPAGGHRHAQRHRQGPRDAHRPGVDERHGRRRCQPRRARCRRARGRT